MAIEFHCPHCSAAIRVPDAYSGKKGSCPKCSQKLLVPDVVPPAAGQATAKAAQPADSTSADSTSADSTSADSTSASTVVPPQLTPPAAAVPSPAANGELPVFVTKPTGQPSISRKLKRKTRRKKSQMLYTIGIPVACLILFFVVVAALMYQLEPELKGTLKGNVAVAMEIPTATVSWSSFQLTEQEQEDAKKAFESRESFISGQMACRIGSQTGTGLEVDFEIGEGFSWYLVNPINDLVLSDWIRDNSEQLNARRMQEISSAGTELCRDKIRKANGDPVAFAADVYRDNFGVNSHVNAFGSVVEAIADNRASMCFHEDANGTLYFALPSGTTTFLLRGRRFDGQALFEGEYTVVVDAAPVANNGSQSSISETETEPAEDVMEQDSDLMEPAPDEQPMMNDSGMMQQ